MKFKRFLISFVTLIFISGSLFAVTPAYAQSNNSQGFNPFSAIVQFFEKIFHFGNGDTQSGTNQNIQNQGFGRPEDATDSGHRRGPQNATGGGQMDIQQAEKIRLDQLVTQGKITSGQEQAILTELQTVTAKYNPQDAQKQTQDQRQQNFKAMEDELTSWAKAQGIDPTYVVQQRGARGAGMRGQVGRDFGPRPSGFPPE